MSTRIVKAVPTMVAVALVFNNSSVSIDFNYFCVSERIHISSCKKTSVSQPETIDFMTKKKLDLYVWSPRHKFQMSCCYVCEKYMTSTVSSSHQRVPWELLHIHF